MAFQLPQVKLRELVAWGLLAVMGAGLVFQSRRYDVALAKAEVAEAAANQALEELKQVREERVVADRRAQDILDQSNASAERLTAILRAGSRAKLSPQPAPVSASLQPPPPQDGQASFCGPFLLEDGQQLQIGPYPVVACGLQSYVGAQAAIDLQQAGAALEARTLQYDAAAKEAAVAKSTIVKLQAEAESYKKAAKKSKFKRALGVVGKVVLFAGGIFIGAHI